MFLGICRYIIFLVLLLGVLFGGSVRSASDVGVGGVGGIGDVCKYVSLDSLGRVDVLCGGVVRSVMLRGFAPLYFLGGLGGAELSIWRDEVGVLLSGREVVLYDIVDDIYGFGVGRLGLRLGGGEEDLLLYLLGRGLAIFLPVASGGSDIASHFSSELEGRVGGLGLWRWSGDFLFSAVDGDGLGGVVLGRRFALVYGEVYDVSFIRERIYINFGIDWRSDFTIVVGEGLVADFLLRYGVDGLVGSVVEVRGFLYDRYGVQVELGGVDYLRELK